MENSSIIFKMNAKDNCFIDKSVQIGKNVTIYPNNILVGNCIVQDNVILYPNNIINDSIICKGATVACSVIEKSVVGEGTTVGPFSRLRPCSEIGSGAKIGNFVEVKNSKISNSTKISHLSYVGDCDIGENVNIGCGVVFVNFNGKKKFRSVVKNGAFVGSSVNVISPVVIGEKSFICAGTNVTENVEDGAFVIGRSRMNVKKSKAKKYLEKE